MADLVLDGFVKNFADSRDLTQLDDSEIFEAFVTYSIFRKYHHVDLSDIEDYIVGGGGDGGLDAVGIFVNGHPVRVEEDVLAFADHLGRLDVEFVFIQAKTSSSFATRDIGNFAYGVEQFFIAVTRGESRLEFNETVQQYVDLAQRIFFEYGIKMQQNPKCFLYFATTGKWEPNSDPAGRLSYGRVTIEGLDLFSQVLTRPVDADLLKNVYREFQRSVVKQIEVSRITVFPAIDGVDEAYIGLVPGNAFVDLVSTNDGDLNRELFYDNVRDFQGRNPVNSEIDRTLTTAQTRHTFPLLNNGITIVAQDVKRRGETFTLSNFQIVNGCQTTHILFQNKDSIDAATFVPVKLVVTRDRQVITEVIKATNRQTTVQPEALESLTPFHKELEDFYNHQEADRARAERIYYERRSKQYSLDDISQKNIVSLSAQITSFVGMFLNEPHSHVRYYGELLNAYRGRLFVHDHSPAPYYCSGVSHVAIERWIRSQPDRQELRNYKYHILMLVRIAVCGRDIPYLNSKAIVNYSRSIVDASRDDRKWSEECRRAADLLKNALAEYPRRGKDGNYPHRLREFTLRLTGDRPRRGTQDRGRAAQRGRRRPSVAQRAMLPGNETAVRPEVAEATGTILWFDEVRSYGRIQTASGEELFVDISELRDVPPHMRTSGTAVVFGIGADPVSQGQAMAMGVKVQT